MPATWKCHKGHLWDGGAVAAVCPVCGSPALSAGLDSAVSDATIQHTPTLPPPVSAEDEATLADEPVASDKDQPDATGHWSPTDSQQPDATGHWSPAIPPTQDPQTVDITAAAASASADQGGGETVDFRGRGPGTSPPVSVANTEAQAPGGGNLDWQHPEAGGSVTDPALVSDPSAAAADCTVSQSDAAGAQEVGKAGPGTGGTWAAPRRNKEKPTGKSRKQAIAEFGEHAHIGGYEVVGTLGRGGMGVVYKARHLALNRLAALKMILVGAHASPRDLARFQIEAEAVAELKHPNIVQIYEVGEHDRMPFFALEYVEGGTLQQQLKNGPLAYRAAAQLIEQLARGVFYAHQKGIIHRDLKPANILLTAEGAPKITDFGLAKRLDEDAGFTAAGDIVGTPHYMSPEQAEGRTSDIGTSTDVYALGAILYDLLTGQPPFKGKTIMDTLNQVRHAEPVAPRRVQPKVPRDLDVICLKCLAKDPGKRYSSAEALADDLKRFLDGRPIHARPVPAWERAGKWARRRPALAALVGLAALVVVLAGTGGYVVAQRERDLRKVADDEKGIAVTERTEADKQRKNAETQKQQAVVQRKLADKHFQQAWDAVDEMFTRVSEEKLAHLPGAEKVRRELLLRAKVFYEEFLKDRGDSTALLWHTAQAYYRVGKVQELLGQYPQAQKAYEASRDVCDQLRRQDPGDAKYLAGQGKTSAGLGVVLQAMNQDKQAAKPLADAVALLLEAHKKQADQPDYQFEYALACNEWANLLQADPASLPQAEKLYRTTLDQVQALSVQSQHAKYAVLQALACNNLAAVLAGSQPGQAMKLFTQAAATVEKKLLPAYPDVPQYRKELGRAKLGLAVLGKGTDAATAAADLATAEQIFAELVKKSSGVIDYEDLLAQALWERSLVFQQHKQFEKAEAKRLQVEPLLTELVKKAPAVPRFQQDLARLCHDRALFQARQLDLGPEYADNAKKLFATALALQGKLVAAYPDNQDYKLDQALSHMNLGQVYQQNKEPTPAEKNYRLALEILDKMGKPAGPLAGQWFRLAIVTRSNLAPLVLKTKGFEPFRKEWLPLIALYEQELQQFPKVAQAHINLAQVCKLLGDELRKRQMLPPARQQYDKALASAQHALQLAKNNAAARELLAQSALGLFTCQLDAGDHAAVSKTAAQLAGDFPKKAAYQSQLAGALGQCVNLVQADAKLSKDEQAALTKKYGDQAMTALRQAVAEGFTDTTTLTKGLAFDGLRTRPDFQKLLKGIAPKKK